MQSKLQKIYTSLYQEDVDVNVAGKRSGSYNISQKYYDEVLKPALDSSKYEDVYLSLYERGIESDMFSKDQAPLNDISQNLFEYINSCTNVHIFAEKIKDKQFQTKVGNTFLDKLKRSEGFDYLELLDTIYDGDFKYDKFLIDNIRPASTFGKTRGAGGPGEAFLAFFFNGTKPQGAGDLVINGELIELKGNGGRIGKQISIDQGINLKNYIENTESTLDTAKEMGVETIGDLLFGKGEWIGMSGTRLKLEDEFFNRPVDQITRVSDNTLEQIIGAIQLKEYKDSIAKFDYFQIFKNTYTIGFDVSIIDKDPFTIIEKFNAKNVMFKYKKTRKSYFDDSGCLIKIMKDTKGQKKAIDSITDNLIEINVSKLTQSEGEFKDLLGEI